MLNRTHRMIVAAALALLTLLPIAAFILLRDSGDETVSPPAQVQRGCTAEEKATEAQLATRPSPTPPGPNLDYDVINRDTRQNTSNPYVGKLCGFEIVANEMDAHPLKYCQGTVSGRDQSHTPKPFLPSELNKSGLREQGVCNDTEVFSTYGDVRRNYFRDTPKMHFDVNREYLRYVEVDGHGVLLRLSPGIMGPVYAAVVQRWPDGDKPGILIALMAGDRAEAIAGIRRALAE
jgi:hypothetical protein